ncbi:MFS transporter [Roseospira navarrensis]|uniref:MFS transporter n=1 Tax=Roseospira navarrensis TaxID=140058 RepID=A0A7X2D4M9_9PROT|nr:MFS transporter [Roseospira navarrensis]MQX36772.1 MFS transporter [Roseospira navarrensis]
MTASLGLGRLRPAAGRERAGPRQPTALGIALLGGAILAITYGLARFVFGLFLPAIRDDLGLTATNAGFVGALPFLSFIIGVLAGPPVSRTIGPRAAGGLAAGLAATGLSAIALAPGVLVLGAGVAICGVSTGLSSPAMALAVNQAVRPSVRGRVNAVHNAGTSIGVALAMPAMVLLMGDWRPTYLGFALVAALGAVAALLFLPRHRDQEPARAAPGPVGRERWAAITRLGAMAGGMGLVSNVYWVFAPDLVVRQGGLTPGDSGWMWLAVGLAGLVGGTAGDLIDRLGPGRTHALALALMSGALALAAATPDVLGLALLSAATFGAAYMTLTGFHLVQGVRIMAEADRPTLGPVVPLLATTVGQASGSSLSGWMIDAGGYSLTFAAFAVVGLGLAGIARVWGSGPHPPPE